MQHTTATYPLNDYRDDHTMPNTTTTKIRRDIVSLTLAAAALLCGCSGMTSPPGTWPSQAARVELVAEKVEVAAGVKQQLEADAKRVPGLRLIDGRFMVINQAMAVPKGRAAGVAYAAAFVEEMKSSGFVAASLKRHGIEGAVVAPTTR